MKELKGLIGRSITDTSFSTRSISENIKVPGKVICDRIVMDDDYHSGVTYTVYLDYSTVKISNDCSHKYYEVV